jgi:hypothetical protein
MLMLAYMRSSWRVTILGLAAVAALAGCGPREPQTSGGPIEVRRLTEAQYRNSIADIFGSDIIVSGRFDPLNRAGGLLAVSAASAAITPTAFEQYDNLARSIAAQIVDEKNRDFLIPCKPASPDAADEACARQFLAKAGRLLFRRPLKAAELKRSVDVADNAAKPLGGFYPGLAYALSGLLETPSFLFITDRVISKDGAVSLDAFSKASRISFLLWDSAPDDELLTAAEQGELDSKRGLTRQVDRLLASPRLKVGVRAFFADMLSLDDFDTIAKDPVIYPAFGLTVANDARESTLRLITDHLITQHGDYRDLFTTRRTFLSGPLGLVYRVPVAAPDDWVAYEFPPDQPRAGILSQIGFAALHSHPGRSSATLRGRAVRELILCEKVPDPPGDVNFALVQDTENPVYKTARQRLTAHRSAPSCAGCHALMDPIGLAMENFDGAGQFRRVENGVVIDTSGDLDGTKYQDPAGLAKAIHDNPATTACIVNRAYQYATGRVTTKDEKDWISYLEKSFIQDGYKFPELLRRIATSDAFYAVSAGSAARAVQAAADGKSATEKKS